MLNKNSNNLSPGIGKRHFQSLTFRSSATTKVIGSCIASIDARRLRNRCGIIEPPR